MQDKDQEISDLWMLLTDYIERFGQTELLRAYCAMKEFEAPKAGQYEELETNPARQLK